MMLLTPSDGLSRHLDTLPRYRRYRHRVIVIYLVSLCVMLALFGWLLKGQYEQELQAAEARAAARASVVAEWTNGVLGQSAQALFGLEELLERQTAEIPNREVQVRVALENLVRYLPLIDELGVLNAGGRAWASSGGNRHAGRDLSQTALFQGFQQSSYAEVVTPLYWSTQDQRFYLYHARRLKLTDGTFDGVVVARLLPEMFSAALRYMGVEEGESVALIDTNLRLVARHPCPQYRQ